MRKRRIIWISAGGGIALIVLLAVFTPRPIEGCYTFSDVTTAGHNFLYFKDGSVTYVREYATNRYFGSYSHVKGEGWIWVDSDTRRRILVRPGIFSIRFDAADGIASIPKVPMELRYWNFRKTAELINRGATNTIGKP